LACYIPRWNTCPDTVTHPSTNRARRALTSFTRGTPLTTACATPPTWVSCMQRLNSTQTKPSRLQVSASCSVDAVVHDCRPTASWAPRRQISSLNSTQLTLNTRVCRLITMLRPGRRAECCDECVCLSLHSCISREPVYNLLLPVFSHNSRPMHTWFRALDSADTLFVKLLSAR